MLDSYTPSDACNYPTSFWTALGPGAGATLARRAQDAGRLRPDFVLDDLIIVLMANGGGIRASTPADAVAASRRFAALAIQALRASPQASPLPPAARLTPVVLIT